MPLHLLIGQVRFHVGYSDSWWHISQSKINHQQNYSSINSTNTTGVRTSPTLLVQQLIGLGVNISGIAAKVKANTSTTKANVAN